MTKNLENDAQDLVVFAGEEEGASGSGYDQQDCKAASWKVLIVDDEEDVHKITRLTLSGYTFKSKGIQFLSAYSESDVKAVMQDHHDIALIILDVVMEKDDSGLLLVEHIRNELKNDMVRIVLRTGQPGKAPEQDIIQRYDINDYKTKPDLTAQKLFTMVTACLRAYDNLQTIQKNTQGLKNIIYASSNVLKHQSVDGFGKNVLSYLNHVLGREEYDGDADGAYFIGSGSNVPELIAGSGKYQPLEGNITDPSMPDFVRKAYKEFSGSSAEQFSEHEYAGFFQSSEETLTVLYLNCRKTFSATDRNLIRVYAANMAMGFDNISLMREIINTQKEVILTLGEIVETRSKETANHVTRVAEICYLLAQKYGLDEDMCQMLRLASPMHDVGKIGIPEAILNKPGKLTDEEFRIIKTHARLGYDILKNSNRPIMKAAAIIALQHHERWDGRGYPEGLAGEDIHIFGRITAVADVYDALSHKRSYKEAWETDRILDLFRSESGSHFDKRLVDILISNLDEFEKIKERFPD